MARVRGAGQQDVAVDEEVAVTAEPGQVSEKASGIDIDVGTGLGMLLLGVLMLVWMKVSAPRVGPAEGDDGDGTDSSARPTAH